MARTPLARWIRIASAIAGRSAQRGTDVEKIIELRQDRRWNRREFIGLGAKAAAAAAFGGLLPPVGAAQFRRSQPVIAVVGGGLAGLTCAYRLGRAGLRATVYEATQRLGGRCFSSRMVFDEGQIIERGGELIDTRHQAVRRLSRELHVVLDDLLAAEPRGSEPKFYLDGASYSLQEAARDFREVFPKLAADMRATNNQTLYDQHTPRGAELDRLSLADYIGQLVPGGRHSRLGKLLDVAYTIEYGADTADQSALNLLYLLGTSHQGRLELFGESDERFHVRGGNDQLVSRLTANLPNQIEFGCALTAIALTSDGRYRLTFVFDGSTRQIVADRVVLALPFSVLRQSVDYRQAGFSELKRTAIQDLGMGKNAKLHLQFADRFWNQSGCNGMTISDDGYQNTWDVTRAQSGRAGILVNFTGGETTSNQGGRSPAQQTEDFLKGIEPVLPGLTQRYNGKSSFDFWPGNPWTHGSYAFWKVGQCTRFAGIESVQEGHCHFCGEHTSVEFMGFLNGAVDSGERVAREIIRAVR